jgi:RNA polymerase sigma-70 factor (ECF subfamily)
MDLESSYELIARAQSGDDAALNRLLARYLPRLRRWATGRLPTYARDLGDTNDLVQETLVGAFRNLKKFDNRGEGALQAYLRQAVMNRIRTELRRAVRQPRREEIDPDLQAANTSPLERAIGHEAMERYERALETLTAHDREAVIARIEMGYSYAEVAQLVGKPSPDAARVAIVRALGKLAEIMAASGR